LLNLIFDITYKREKNRCYWLKLIRLLKEHFIQTKLYWNCNRLLNHQTRSDLVVQDVWQSQFLKPKTLSARGTIYCWFFYKTGPRHSRCHT
jgi:hypothetical protein